MHLTVSRTFHCQGHLTVSRTFHCQAHFTVRDISLSGTFHCQAHFTVRHISLAGTFHWQAHFTGRHISLEATFHCQAHFTGRRLFLSWGDISMLSGHRDSLPTSNILRSGPEEANLKWYGQRGVKQSYHAKQPYRAKRGKFCNLRSSGSAHIAFHDQLLRKSKWEMHGVSISCPDLCAPVWAPD